MSSARPQIFNCRARPADTTVLNGDLPIKHLVRKVDVGQERLGHSYSTLGVDVYRGLLLASGAINAIPIRTMRRICIVGELCSVVVAFSCLLNWKARS